MICSFMPVSCYGSWYLEMWNFAGMVFIQFFLLIPKVEYDKI